MKLQTGALAVLVLLLLASCSRSASPGNVAALLRAQGFRYLDEPMVSIAPLCSMQIGSVRYDFYWYEWWQQDPVGARHANFRLIQIRDGKTYDGNYGGLPRDPPLCRPDQRQIIFGSNDPDPRPSFVGVGVSGLPNPLYVDGEYQARDH